MSRWRRGTIDSRGKFLIDHLPPGEYEIKLDAYFTPFEGKFDEQQEGPVTVTKLITVSNSAAAEIDFVLDLSAIKPKKQR